MPFTINWRKEEKEDKKTKEKITFSLLISYVALSTCSALKAQDKWETFKGNTECNTDAMAYWRFLTQGGEEELSISADF